MRATAAFLWGVCSAAAAQAAGFGPPEGTLPVYPLPVAVAPGSLSPLLSASLFREQPGTGHAPVYYLGAGVAGARLQIPDSPGATAWKIIPTPECSQLEPIPTAQLRAPSVEAVVIQQNALPLQCAAAFEGSCTSRDGKLRITTSFEGKRRAGQVRGGFFGSENSVPTTFYTGVRTLSIEHLPSRRSVRMHEQLNNTNGYSAPQSAIRYLPELQRIVLLGASEARGMPTGHCIALPPS